MKFLRSPIFYLESSDFDSDGNIINPHINTKLPIFIMIQANFCGYCTMAKPEFQRFAEVFENQVTCATIQADSEKPDHGMKNLISILCPELQGFPTYIILYQNKIILYNKGRSFEDMKNFFSN
jgi:thiol-disulfide isomerase/thioredoxin